MAGVWETLFYEEKQDWITFMVNSASTILAFALELPCMVLAFISTTLILAMDYTCQGANLVSDTLGLRDWWALEHTIWSLMLMQALAVSRVMSKNNNNAFMLRMLFNLQCMLAWGCFLFMLNGLQGGVVFGGKFYHPTLAFMAVTAQILKLVYRQVGLEADGFEHDVKPSSERVATAIDTFGHILGYYATFFLFVATFGLPKLDLEADPRPWLAILPVLAFVYNGPDFMAKLSGAKAVEANGTASPITEAPAEEKKATEEPAKAAEEPAKEEATEKTSEAVEAKANFLKAMTCKAVGCVTLTLEKACGCVNVVKAKVMGLPWPAIIGLVTNMGSVLGMTLAYWSLTEDLLVLVAPVVILLGPLILSKLEARNWVDAKGVHLGTALLKTVALGVQYYIFRSYISQPI